MKSNIKQLLLVFLACGQVPFAWAMQAPVSLKPTDYSLRFSPKDSSVADLIAAINQTPQGGLIAMNGSFINNSQVVQALKHAQARGVRLELCVDARKLENQILLQELVHNGLYATNCLHTKRCIIYDVDPRDDLQAARNARSALLFTGSENLSNNAGTHHEYTFISKQPKLIKRHYQDHLRNKALCAEYKPVEGEQKEFHRTNIDSSAKKQVPLSPRFTRIYNSQRYHSGKLKEARIAKPVPADAKEQIYISSMGLDDDGIAHALRDKARAGTEVILVVDKSAVNSAKGLPLLNELHAAGVKVYVWMGSSIQHTKLLLRERRNKLDGHYLDSLAVLSTGNLVKNSATEINYDQIIPASHAVSQDIRNCFATLIKVCTPFADIDQKAVALKKANKGKDVYSTICGICNEVVGAPAQKTVIKKLVQHCVQLHENQVQNSASIPNVVPKKVYCAICPECSQPFYNEASEAKVTYSIAQHLAKEHSVTKENAEELRGRIPVLMREFYIAEKKDAKK